MSGVPDKLWPHVVSHAVWLVNRTPSKPLTHPQDGRSMTPHEAYTGKKPIMTTLRAFGCHTSIKLAKQGVLAPKGRYGYYLGPDESSVRDSVRVLLESTGRVVSGRSFTCNELRFPWLDKKEGREPFFSTWAERRVEIGPGAPPAAPAAFPPIIIAPPPPPPADEPAPPAAAPADAAPVGEQEGAEGEQEGAEGEPRDGGDDHHEQQQLPQPPQMGARDVFAADDEQEDDGPRRSGRERRPPPVYVPESGTYERQETNALTVSQKVAKWKKAQPKLAARHAQYLIEHSVPPGEGDAVYKRAQLAKQHKEELHNTVGRAVRKKIADRQKAGRQENVRRYLSQTAVLINTGSDEGLTHFSSSSSSTSPSHLPTPPHPPTQAGVISVHSPGPPPIHIHSCHAIHTMPPTPTSADTHICDACGTELECVHW